MKLRPYQEEILSKIRLSMAAGNKRIVMQLATGGGKTAMFAAISKMAVDKGNSVLIITHRKELLSQSGGTLSRFELKASELTAKTKKIEHGILYVAMVETIKARISKPGYDAFVKSFKIIIIDECHLQNFNRIFESLNSDQYVIGATATPYRDGKMKELKEYYDDIIQGIQISELIEAKYLSPAISYGFEVDLSNVRITAGEFNEKDLQEVYDENSIYVGAITNYLQHANGTKFLAFCPTVKNSESLCNQFNEAGISARHLDATTPANERDAILQAYNKNEFKGLCNVGILTTGFDQPDVETIILYRATKSLPLFLQMCGRGSRIAPGKEKFNILDFGNNIGRHGFWQADRNWTLSNPETKKRKEKKGEYKIKICEDCGAMVPASTRICPHCGFEFPAPEEKKSIKIASLKLLTPTQINRLAELATVQELEEIRIAKEYKVGWVLYKLKTFNQFKEYEKLKNYKRGWAEYQWRSRH